MRKISKDIVKYIIINALGQRPKEFTNSLFKKFDFDHNDKYTIGGFKNFLIGCEEILNDPDLIFFYENFPVIGGRVSLSQINYFIEINSEKNSDR